MKKKPKYNQNAMIRGALRRQFARSPIVREVMGKVRREVPRFNKDGSRAKKDAVQYLCAVCGTWTKSTAISVDHIAPVIDVEDGFVDWNEFIQRLFCGPENLQVVCDDCHQRKTNQERFIRSFKVELAELSAAESIMANKDDVKKFLRKFTNKRLEKYPYPLNFKERIIGLKQRIGMRIK